MHVDVVVPVWNRPAETRNCLVRLVSDCADCRVIIIDNGSERETEALLEELADGLNERALLIRNENNIGFVRAVNEGLARVTAPFAAVMRPTTEAGEGWLAAILHLAAARPEAGIILPSRDHGSPPFDREASHGAFDAMFLRGRMLEAIGGFDETLDGAAWCLKDYSRRAFAAGYTTVVSASSRVHASAEPELGSEARRRELHERSRSEYERRWGTEKSYFIEVVSEDGESLLREHAGAVETAARLGHRVTLLLHRRLSRNLGREKFIAPHESIGIIALPALLAERAREKAWQKERSHAPDAVRISASERNGADLAAFADEILRLQRERFHGTSP
ncbi:MAG TPA: glycosyltransferase [Verrucomicrobiae bacterium]|nr:glycosyltransferase [Verrucomicrobiae bacterium]